MATRKAISKGLRFDIFRRDGFTCQYCGRQPPDVVLEIDHIRPVAEGGNNDILNLTTACSDCNAGKAKKLLDHPQRPDADAAWLEAQQELAELRRYQRAKIERDELLAEIIELLQNAWMDISGLDWAPAKKVIRNMLQRYSPEEVEIALTNVAPKVADGYVGSDGRSWVPYTWGVLKKIAGGG